MNFSPGDILLVPVMFSDGSGHKKRPVVIIYDSGDADLLVAPVTSQMARSPRDVALVNLAAGEASFAFHSSAGKTGHSGKIYCGKKNGTPCGG